MDNFNAGQVELSGSAEQLSALPKSVSGVIIKSHEGNMAKVYIGPANTVSSSTGYELDPGEAIPIDILNPGRLWVIGTAGEKLSWATVRP